MIPSKSRNLAGIVEKCRTLTGTRIVILAISVAVVSRVTVFITALIWPIANERGEPVSPALSQAYFDFQFYLESLARYSGSWLEIAKEFVQFYQAPFSAPVIPLISGPVFPLLMDLFGYGPGNHLPLAIFYLIISCSLAAAWLVWLSRKGVGWGWLIVFALIPNPIWFTLVISPDLLFAALFAIFFFLYFESSQTKLHVAGWVATLILMLLLRPNGFSVLLFVSAHAGWNLIRSRKIEFRRLVLVLTLVVIFGLYLYPYFLSEMQKAGGILTYFGYTPAEYIDGVFQAFPRWLDLPLSWLALIGSKLVYFVGLRPSYGVTDPTLVLARGAAGVFLLPGLLWLFAKGRRSEMAMIVLYCAPILLGPAQDRYYLAIYPILFLYGVRFYEGVWRVVSGKFFRAATANLSDKI